MSRTFLHGPRHSGRETNPETSQPSLTPQEVENKWFNDHPNNIKKILTDNKILTEQGLDTSKITEKELSFDGNDTDKYIMYTMDEVIKYGIIESSGNIWETLKNKSFQRKKKYNLFSNPFQTFGTKQPDPTQTFTFKQLENKQYVLQLTNERGENKGEISLDNVQITFFHGKNYIRVIDKWNKRHDIEFENNEKLNEILKHFNRFFIPITDHLKNIQGYRCKLFSGQWFSIKRTLDEEQFESYQMKENYASRLTDFKLISIEKIFSLKENIVSGLGGKKSKKIFKKNKKKITNNKKKSKLRNTKRKSL